VGTVSRNMTIVYGAVTLGSGSYTIHDVHTLRRDQDGFDLSATVLVTSSTAGGLATACQALETEFTKRRLDLTVTVGGGVFLELKHSDNTALNITASISKNGSPHDSSISRLYQVTVSGTTSPNSPPQTSSLSIVYGSVTIAGSLSGGTLSLHEVHSITRDQDTFELSASVLVKGATSALLAAACVSLEAEFTTRRLDLVVTMGGNTILALRQSDNTALNTTASIEKEGSPLDSELTRLYRIIVSGEVPTKPALSALRSFNYDITFSPSRKTTLTATGSYTAVGGGSTASAQYLSAISARVATIISALGGTYELITETYTPDDTNQLVNFERVYKELLYNQSSGALDRTEIRDQTLTIKSDIVGSEGLRDERKLNTIGVSYSASVDATSTKDLINVWDSIAKPWIVDNLKKVAKTTKIAILSQNINYDYVENRIDASMEARARMESDVLAHTVSATDDIDMGKIIARVWPTEDMPGVRETSSAYVYQGPRIYTRTITETTTRLGIPNLLPPGVDAMGGLGKTLVTQSRLKLSADGDAADQVSTLEARDGVLIKYSESQTPKSLGVRGDQISIVDTTKTWVFEFLKAISSTGSGGATPAAQKAATPSGPKGYKGA
jgi:hypothetical protein